MDPEARTTPHPVGSFLVAFYGWVVTAFFGAALLDTVYARAIRSALDAARAETLFSEASDVLLLGVALAILSAIAAIGSAWQSNLARNLLLASALLVVAELAAPVVLRPFLVEPGAGAWVRLLLSGSASVLGLLGLSRFCLRS